MWLPNLPLHLGTKDPFHTCPRRQKLVIGVCNHTCGYLGKYPFKMSRPGFKIAIVQIVFNEREEKEKVKENMWDENQGSTQAWVSAIRR